jgi:hypothetical protein
MARPCLSSLLVLFLTAFMSRAVFAQVTSRGGLTATVTTQSGSVRLPGVALTVTSLEGRTIASDFSDGDGALRLTDLAPGLYRVRASLSGFDDVSVTVRVDANAQAAVNLDLPVSGVAERVDVIGNAETAPPSIGQTLSTKGVLESRVVEQLPIRDNSVMSALKLLAGIVDGPGGVSIKGGRSNQSGLQIGMATLTDTSTGAPLFKLPADAIDSVEVLPNPYAVEFGRFSSGLTVVNTKRAGDSWRVLLNAPDFSFRADRTSPWKLTGIESFGPRIGVGGPLVKGRLFLEQSAQFRYEVSEVWSRPTDQTRNTMWLSAFTRLDANLSPGQSLIGSFNFFPSKVSDINLNTFNGPDVSADQHDRLIDGSVAAHSVLTDKAVLESTVQLNGFRVDVAGHGTAPMELIPAQNAGNFFNQQHRMTQTLQWVEAATGSYELKGVTHLFKVGADLMHTNFDGTSDSQPVEVRRDDLTLTRRLTFIGPSQQDVVSTDFAVFAQDRVQLKPRLLLEFGARIDRDGVLAKTNATPRVGLVLLLNSSGSSVVRGGYGLFYERTPSVVGAFSQFETMTDTRYGRDGATVLGAPRLFENVTAPNMEVARSATWNLELDERVTPQWSLRASVLERRGSHEAIVTPQTVGTGPDALNTLELASDGRSLYREGEVTLRYAAGPRFDVSGTYVRSSAYANLNNYTAFFNNVRWPIISSDAYAPTSNNTPNRLVTSTRMVFGQQWLLSSIFELHSGFPYSVTNDTLDWVGPRNQTYHFPVLAMLDLDFEHKFTSIKGKPWIGFRAYNALNRFTPIEVQSNLGSSTFGTFYNSYGRQIRLQIRIEH